MASVRKRGQKYTGLYRDASGAQRSAGSFDTEAEALKAARHAEALANPLEPAEVHPTSKRGKITVAAYAPKWLDGLLVEPNTRLAYGLSVKHIIACMGGQAVADVEPDDIRGLIRHMEKLGRADNTIRHAVVVADLMFRAARPKLRDDNPCDGIKVKLRDQREMLFATREQARAIEDAIPDRYKLLVRALFATGCRWGEMIAVKGSDVEQRGSGYVLKIRRTIGETDGVGIYARNYGKSAKAKRDITIPEALALDLMAYGDKLCFTNAKGGSDVPPPMPVVLETAPWGARSLGGPPGPRRPLPATPVLGHLRAAPGPNWAVQAIDGSPARKQPSYASSCNRQGGRTSWRYGSSAWTPTHQTTGVRPSGLTRTTEASSSRDGRSPTNVRCPRSRQ